MRGPRFLAIIMMSILISVSVKGEVPHENFEDAEFNEFTVQIFIGKTLEDMSKIFLSILDDDPSSASSHSRNLSIKINKISETIEDIPSDIDSYEILSLYLQELQRAERNISILSRSFSVIKNAVDTASNFSIGSWNLSEVTRSFKEIDDALLKLPGALSDLHTSSISLEEDLGLLNAEGLDLSYQLSLLLEMLDLFDDLQTDWIGPDIVEGPVISAFMVQWGKELLSLKHGSPKGTIQNITDILTSLDLRSSLVPLVGSYIEDFRKVDESVENIWILTDGLERIKIELEMSTNRYVAGKYGIYKNATDDLVELGNEIEFQWSVWSSYSEYDDGPVEENLTKLESSYWRLEDWFSSLNLIEEDLQRLSDLSSMILDLNLIHPDKDGNGNLSYEEGFNLIIPDIAITLLDNLTLFEEEISSGLSSIEGDIAKEFLSILKVLNKTVIAVKGFTNSHRILINGIKILTEPDQDVTGSQHVEAFMKAAGSFLRMSSTLETLSKVNVPLHESKIIFDNSSIAPLFTQLDLYKDLLLNISNGRNLTGVYFELDERTVPYDSNLTARVLIVERDLSGATYFPDDRTVQFKFDDTNLSTVITSGGVAEISIQMNRSFDTGIHAVSISYLPENSSYFNLTKEFTLRKIITYVKASVLSHWVDPGKEFHVNISIVDEYGRQVEGNITVNGENSIIIGSIEVPIMIHEFGEQFVDIRFTGDEWYRTSSRKLLMNVSTGPIIEVIFERSTVYQGDPMNISIRIVHGSGLVRSFLDGIVILNGTRVVSTDSIDLTLNTTDLVLGLHSIKVDITTNVSWVRNGSSPRMVFKVVERPIIPDEPVEPPDDDDDQPLDDNDETDEESKLVKYLRIFGVVIVAVLILLSIGLLVQRIRKSKERPKLVMPKRFKKGDGTEGVGTLKGGRKDLELDPDQEKAKSYLPDELHDPNRVKVVAYYLDVVDRIPKEIDIRRSDTPREAQGKFIKSGADKKISADLAEGFEEALYKKGGPSIESVQKVQRSASSLSLWISSFQPENKD